MGTVFGKSNIEEPAFKVLLKSSGQFPYDVRQYGERFVAEASYAGSDDTPFTLLAKYIGVFGTPENEGHEAIPMTAPVVKETHPEAISMTAPVIKTEGNVTGEKVMQFMLPAKYDSLDKIPTPTNPAVRIRELPPAAGAVHVYSGSFSEDLTLKMVSSLALQLKEDGLQDMTETFAHDHYSWFGYNPPFTLPPFRRNEVWLPLTPEQVELLVNGHSQSSSLN